MRGFLVAVVALAGCSKILGIDDLSGPGSHDDAAPADGTHDAPPDVPLPNRITFSGTLQHVGLAGNPPCANCAVDLVRPDTTIGGTTSSDGTGAYQLAVPTANMAVDGYLRVRDPNSLESDAFLPAPATADMHLDISVYDPSVLNNLAAVCGAMPGGGFVAVIVESHGARLAGVAVQPGPGVPGRVYYASAQGTTEGMPQCPVAQTTSVGVAWVINTATQTPSRFDAIQAGATLGSVTVTAHSNAANIVRIVVN